MRRASSGRILLIAGSMIAVAAPGEAQVFGTGNFDVTITIVDECILTTPISALAFPNAGVLTAQVLGQTTITVRCTAGTDFTLEIDEGNGAGATTLVRKMTGSGLNTATIDYELYQEVGLTNIWGLDTGGNAVDLAGTGAAEAYIVYGRVPPQTTPMADTYTDTVTVTAFY